MFVEAFGAVFVKSDPKQYFPNQNFPNNILSVRSDHTHAHSEKIFRLDSSLMRLKSITILVSAADKIASLLLSFEVLYTPFTQQYVQSCSTHTDLEVSTCRASSAKRPYNTAILLIVDDEITIFLVLFEIRFTSFFLITSFTADYYPRNWL